MLVLPPAERNADAQPSTQSDDRFPIPLLAEAREAGVDYDLLIAATTEAMKRRYPSENLPLWWTLLTSAPAIPDEPWPIELLRVDTAHRGYLGFTVRAVLNTADQAVDRDDLIRILAVEYPRQVLASSLDVRIEPLACGFNLLHPDGTGAFVGRRYDVSDTRDARLSAITCLLKVLADRRAVIIHLSWGTSGRVARYSSSVFGYQDAMQRLTITVTGATRDHAVRRDLHTEIVDIVNSYDAHEGFRIEKGRRRPRALAYAANVVFLRR